MGKDIGDAFDDAPGKLMEEGRRRVSGLSDPGLRAVAEKTGIPYVSLKSLRDGGRMDANYLPVLANYARESCSGGENG